MTQCVVFEENFTQHVRVLETAPLIPVLLDDNMLPEPEKTYAAVAPDPENVAVAKVKEVPDFKPITVLPVPVYDLIFPASIANTTSLNELFFGPL
jgi:hypothetical protein